MKKFLLLPVLACAISPAAMAWDDAGHNVIVAIAQNHLTPRAKENISRYIPYDLVKDSIVVLHIRMLIHFVGDLHCPVHLGIPSCWFPKPPYRLDVGKWYYEGRPYKSLHAFIDKAPELLYPGLGEYEIAERLDKVTKRQVRQWVKGDFVEWTNDAARTGFRIFGKQRPVWEVPDTPESKYLPEGYLEDIRDTINEELLKGGYRLAFLLNKYFDR